MKKQYIFLVMIILILYIFYLIISFTYKEYKINSNIEYITNLNNEIKKNIHDAHSIIKFKTSKAYRNKILKEQQSLKNKWEKVIYLTTEKKYNKYTSKTSFTGSLNIKIEDNSNSVVNTMSVFEKWIYLIFWKDIR